MIFLFRQRKKICLLALIEQENRAINLSFGFFCFYLSTSGAVDWGRCPQIPRQRVYTLWNPVLI